MRLAAPLLRRVPSIHFPVRRDASGNCALMLEGCGTLWDVSGRLWDVSGGVCGASMGEWVGLVAAVGLGEARLGGSV